MSGYLKKVLIIFVVLPVSTCNSVKNSSVSYGKSKSHISLSTALNKINFIDSHIVHGNIYLPDQIDNIDIIWTNSSNPAVLNSKGIVNRPSLSQGDTKVTINAFCKYSDYMMSREFEFVVKAKGASKEVFKVGSRYFTMIYIPPGNYSFSDIKETYITDDFYIGEFEVSRGLYYSVMEGDHDIDSPNIPVSNISWDEAITFCEKLNLITGAKFRLPTEYEWEYAAKGDDNFLYSGGDALGSIGRNGTIEPTKYNNRNYTPNSFGLYHMSGNVAEWTSDSFSDISRESENPVNPGRSGDYISVRGGSFKSEENNCLVITRDYEHSIGKREDLGIRLALSN